MGKIYSMKRLNFYLTLESLKFLEKIASKEGTSISEIIRRAINEFIERKKKEKLNVSKSLSKG